MADVARSVKARAISATTNAFDRRRAGAAADARTPSESTAFGAVRIACQSGARPASTPVATATATLKPSTVQSMVMSSTRGMNRGRGGQDLPNEDHAQTDAGGGARDRHERAFGEVAQRELASRRAERDADRRLAGAHDRSRQQQRGDVGAGNEQQEAGAAEQDQQRGADARADHPDRRLAQVGHAGRVVLVACGIDGGDGGGDSLGVRLRLFQRHPGFAAGVRDGDPAASARVGRRRIERNPHLGVAA